jgi:hypothetical protein
MSSMEEGPDRHQQQQQLMLLLAGEEKGKMQDECVVIFYCLPL